MRLIVSLYKILSFLSLSVQVRLDKWIVLRYTSLLTVVIMMVLDDDKRLCMMEPCLRCSGKKKFGIQTARRVSQQPFIKLKNETSF